MDSIRHQAFKITTLNRIKPDTIFFVAVGVNVLLRGPTAQMVGD